MSSPHPSLRGVVRALSLSVVLALAAVGCSSGSGSSTDGPSRSDEPATLTIATSFGIDDLDPLENSFWGPEFGYVELLMRPARDGNPTPWVLQSLTPVDERTWTLTLRDNVVFENGKRLDADALVSLLMSGATDSAIAGQFGVTERSVRRWIADLMDELDVRTRLQLGAALTKSQAFRQDNRQLL